MSSLRRITSGLALAFAGAAAFLCASVKAAPPAPGTQIISQAVLNYVDPVLYIGRDLFSNTVVTVVPGAPEMTLIEDRTQTLAPGSYFAFPHRLANTGNTTETFTLTPSVLPGGDFALEQLALVLDNNGNQVVDPGEPFLPFAAHSVDLLPGQILDFLLVGLVSPATPITGAPQTTRLQVEARLDSTAATLVNTDTIHIGTGELQFFKSVSTPVAARGDLVAYTLSGTNNYPAALAPLTVTIDGAPVSRVVVRDDLPANIQFVEFISNNNATPLYHLAGQPLHTYVTTPPADLGQVDAIAFAFLSIPQGNSFSVSFRARVGQAASGLIPNTARVYSQQGATTLVTTSNVALLNVPPVLPTIEYHRDSGFNQVIPATKLGSDLFVEVYAGDCNDNASTINTINITIKSFITGDQETFLNVPETGPNTGVFRILPFVPTQDAAVHPVTHNDGIIQTVSRDILEATITSCDNITVNTVILIDPAGIVYDSRTNATIPGATVTLIDVTGAGNGGTAGGPAVVFDEDGVTPISATQLTGADGEFRFPLVSASVYRLEVVPPPDYNFPSVIPIGLQPAGRRVQVGSYGGNFPVNLVTGAVFLDVPLDTTVGDGLALEKTVSRDTAEIGDSVIYKLTLTNTSGAAFNYTFIDDYLPPAFRYESGTTRRDGVTIADPEGAPGRHLRFPVGTLADGASVTFTYRVRLTFGAEKGNGINTAQATSYGPPILVSNVARARVRVGEGVFDSRGVIIGTVFVDLDGNGVQDPGEPGVPGVRLILEDGTYVITDPEGQYSIYGQRPITHVLKLDPHTLPPGANLGGVATRFAGDPGSRFIDLKRHELHKANFLLVEPTEGLLEAVAARRAAADTWRPEIDGVLDRALTADGRLLDAGDVRGREAAGIVSGRGASPVPAPYVAVLPEGTLTPGNSNLPPSPVAPIPSLELEKLVATLADGEPGFIDLRDGDVLPRNRVTVRVKGHPDSTLALLVNGEPAPESRVGKRVRQETPALQAAEYVALQLRAGPNLLELVQTDLFGNERERRAITVIAPGELARLRMYFSNEAPIADGRTPVEVAVVVEDKDGNPVTAGMPVTLEATLGRWDVEDMNLNEPGTQVFLSGGRGTFRLLPPLEPGEARLAISSGDLKDERRLAFLPELRPMVAVGVIEGRFALNRLSRNNILPLDPGDAFEEHLRESAGIGADGNASGRAAFYLKGKIRGDTLLTIAYDSDKRRDDQQLFRDLDPDAFYPVYGDSSVRGYDAQSTGKLYVRIDRNRSYFLLGDYNTRAPEEVRQLGNYNRSLNGVRFHHETSRFKGDVWASDDSTTQIIREIPANGTSGPFNFQAGSGILGSEVVEVLVRDRNQTSVIINTRRLVRNTDYEFEPFTGRLLLRRPLPSVDENFNPQSLRITYETESASGERFWVYGGDARVKLHDRVEVGGSFARDENPLQPYELQSVDGTVRIASGTWLMAEGARSDSFLNGEGLAGRVEIRHQSALTDARIHYGITEAAFDNPSSTLNAGRIEGGAKVTRVLADRTRLIGEAVHTEDQSSSGNRQGVRVDIAHTLQNQVTLTAGARVSEETVTPANPAPGPGGPATTSDISVRSLRVRVDTPVPYYPRAAVFAEYEQDVVEADQRMIAGGGAWQANDKTRLYARHEFISSLGGSFELNQTQQNNRTLVGVETEYLRDAHFFNEYRVQNAIDGGQAEASTGLRNGWQVADGLRLNTTFERVTPIDGTAVSSRESTAATIAADYTAPADWKATGRVEGRWSESTDTYLNTFGYARKLNDEWTFLGRTILNVQLNAASEDLFQGRVLGGFAWRQHGKDEWNALFRYEYKYEEGSLDLAPAGFGLQRQVHQAAVTTNYQPERDWIFSATWAGKFVSERWGNGDPDADYFAQLIAGRILYDITERWDAGLNLGVTFSDSLQNVRYAVGPEIGYRFKRNVRIGVGYNIVGFSDRDFDTTATAEGLFLSLRIKFDENLLKWARFDRSETSP